MEIVGRLAGEGSLRLVSIEPFVFGVEFGNRNVRYLHLADRPVTATWFDEDRRHWFDGIEFAIQLHVSFAFEDEVDLGKLLVVMRLRVFFDLNEMNGSNRIVGLHERSPRCAAGARHGIDVAEMGYFETLAHSCRKWDSSFVEHTRAFVSLSQSLLTEVSKASFDLLSLALKRFMDRSCPETNPIPEHGYRLTYSDFRYEKHSIAIPFSIQLGSGSCGSSERRLDRFGG